MMILVMIMLSNDIIICLWYRLPSKVIFIFSEVIFWKFSLPYASKLQKQDLLLSRIGVVWIQVSSDNHGR